MAILAVVFDIGGVLERVADPAAVIAPKWMGRLGMSAARFWAAMGIVDPDRLSETGRMSETEYRQRCAAALALSPDQADEFMADIWDWYCGKLDTDMHAFARSLRRRFRTAILSNSAAGARREEQARYRFGDDFDPIIYSHEVGLAKPDPGVFELACAMLGTAPDQVIFIDDMPANVASASRLGMHAILHTSAAATIAAVRALTL